MIWLYIHFKGILFKFKFFCSTNPGASQWLDHTINDHFFRVMLTDKVVKNNHKAYMRVTFGFVMWQSDAGIL